MALVIGVLGPLTIESDGAPLGKLPKKARALLAYLSAQGGRPVGRERLADLLWPYQASDQARHSLRNCVLELRKMLGSAHHLIADFTTCRLDDVDVDLDRFAQLSLSPQQAELQAAADLYRGELLADFLIDSEPFQEWLATERDRTLDLACNVLQRLIATQDAAGRHDATIRSARRLVALDQLSEIGQRALIRAYARAGRRPEALRQYRSCAEILKRELGVAPDAETQALANSIARSGNASAPAPVGRSADGFAEDNAAAADAPHRLAENFARQWPTRLSGRVKPLWPCVLPSIGVGVAPMRNLTGDPDQQYVVEAFTEDLVTDLLRHGRGLALARLADGQRGADAFPAASEPETEYVVSGSAQRSGPRTLRVNMQIADAATVKYRWACRYEVSPDDLASVQTKITRQISRELHVLLLQEASRRSFAATDEEIGVNECLARAAAALKGRSTPELTAQAQNWLLGALARDPHNVEALTSLAFTCQHVVSNPGWGDPRAVSVSSDLGREVIALALALAPGRADAHCIQGMLRSAAGQLEEAARSFERALTVDQRLGIAHGFAGYNAALLGHAEATMASVERAMRSDQSERRQSIFFFYGGFAELLLGRREAAIALLQKSLERNPGYGGAQLFLMAALSLAGRNSDAARAAGAFRTQYPEYRENAFEQQWLWRSAAPVYRAQIDPVFESIRNLELGA